MPEHHNEQIYNKPFNGLTGPRHVTTNQAVARQKWVASTPFGFCNLAKAFKHYYIFGHQNRNNNHSLLLLFDGPWKVNANWIV